MVTLLKIAVVFRGSGLLSKNYLQSVSILIANRSSDVVGFSLNNFVAVAQPSNKAKKGTNGWQGQKFGICWLWYLLRET
jgi:hypothetical protein